MLNVGVNIALVVEVLLDEGWLIVGWASCAVMVNSGRVAR